MPDIDLAIIGGGIAGLSASVACNKIGRAAHVFESATAFEPLGTSLSLWPNAMKCLADWNLAQDVANAGHSIDQLAWRRADGRPYFVQPLKPLYDHVGATGICLRRADLHQILADAIPTDQLHTGHQLQKIVQHVDQTELHFANGETVTANHVIAADGIHSALRAQTLNDGAPTYSGYGAWLGHSSARLTNASDGEGCEYFGPSGRFGVFETGDDTRYWFLVANRASTEPPADPNDAHTQMSGWPDDMRNLVGSTSAESTIYVPFFDRKVARRWGTKTLTLIGDAQHPFVPNLGQGACQAIEDAHALAAGLDRGIDTNDLSDWLAKTRLKRTRYMQATSHRIGELAQSNSRIMRAALGLYSIPPFSNYMRAELQKQFTLPLYPDTL
jgi:2-polyprenyl-6-methoxyphenol hydroxylase-like FAD-dependent oxidoreductase